MRSKVLSIDDESDLLQLATCFFEEENLDIDTCMDVPSALALIQDNRYDVIISDLKMPTGNGHELIAEFKRKGNIGKCILITGSMDDFSEEERRNCDLIMLKPLSFDDLLANIRKIL